MVKSADIIPLLNRHAMELSKDLTFDGSAIIGPLTGATALITGRIFDVHDQTVIMAKIAGVTTGCIYGEMVQGSPDVPLDNLASQLAEKLAEDLSQKRESFTTPLNAEPAPAAFGQYKGMNLPIYNWKEASPHRVNGRMYPVGRPTQGIVAAVVDTAGNQIDEAVISDINLPAPEFVVASYLSLEKWRFRTMTIDGKATSYIVLVPVFVPNGPIPMSGFDFDNIGESWMGGVLLNSESTGIPLTNQGTSGQSATGQGKSH